VAVPVVKLPVPVSPPSLDEIVADPEVPLLKSPEFVISQYTTVPLSTSVVVILNVAVDPSSTEVGLKWNMLDLLKYH